MYDNARIFHTNLLSSVDPYSYNYTKKGMISGVIKNGSGSAVMSANDDSVDAGDIGYKYYNNLLITVEIDSVAAGKEIGSATYKWRTNETDTDTWEATGRATSTSWGELGTLNAYIKFTAGTGDDFALGDTFSFFANASFSAKHLTDGRRDTIYRAYDNNADVVWDLGTATNVTVAALFDPIYADIPSYVRLKAGTTSSCADYSADFDLSASPAVIYLNETYRYWKIDTLYVADTTISFTQFFLGNYVEFPAGAMYNWGSSERLVSEMADNALFDSPRRILANRRELTLKWAKVYSGHRSYFDNLYAATRQAADGMEHPVFVHLYPTDDGESLYWMKLINNLDREWTDFQRDTINLQFREVAPNYAL